MSTVTARTSRGLTLLPMLNTTKAEACARQTRPEVQYSQLAIYHALKPQHHLEYTIYRHQKGVNNRTINVT